jgi:hypothetical protein
MLVNNYNKAEYNKLISEINLLKKEIEDFKRSKPNFVKRLLLVLSKKEQQLDNLLRQQ